MPGGTFCVMNATCSVSAKKLSGMRSSTRRPTGIGFENFLGDELGRIENIEIETVGKFLVEELEVQLPFREIAGLDGVPKIAPVEVRIGAVDLDRLVPDHRLHAELRLPDEFDEGGFVLRIDQPEGVHAKALHEAEGARDGPVGHDPHDHVHRFRGQADEVPEIIVRRLRLRKGAVGLGFHRMNDVRKLDRVLDEEDRDVVADEIPVSFLGIEFDGEAAHVARQVERTFRTGDGREPHEDGRFLAGALEDVGAGICGKRFIGLEIAVRAIAARMNDALRNALMVEMKNLLAEVEILDQRGTALADLQGVLVVGNRPALRRGQDFGIASAIW